MAPSGRLPGVGHTARCRPCCQVHATLLGAGHAARHRRNVLDLYFCPFIYSQICEQNILIFEKRWTDFDANWHKWSIGQGHEKVDFEDQEVKVIWGQR